MRDWRRRRMLLARYVVTVLPEGLQRQWEVSQSLDRDELVDWFWWRVMPEWERTA